MLKVKLPKFSELQNVVLGVAKLRVVLDAYVVPSRPCLLYTNSDHPDLGAIIVIAAN